MISWPFERRLSEYFDWQLTILVLLLCCLGLLVLSSAGYDPDTGQSFQMRRQAASMGLGFGAYVIGSFLTIPFCRRWGWLLFGVVCVMLIYLDYRGIVAGGARRWLEIGGMSALRVQPSEFMKLAMILVLARVFGAENAPRNDYTLPRLFVPGIIILIPALLIAKQPDLGTALCCMLIGGSMVLMAGVRFRTILVVTIFAIALAVPAWHNFHDYQKQRVLTFLAPEKDPKGRGYHAIQSQIAVGSGALAGKGYRRGTQTQLRFLPEQTTDFIFSVLAEEWGFVGSAFVIAIYFLLMMHLLQLVSRTNDHFGAFVIFGMFALIFWQVFINIGMVIGVVPVVGITLPLLSYGGSSVLTIMAGLGIVSGISRRRFIFATSKLRK